MHFDKAITALEAKNMEELANQLQQGADALINEGRFLKGEPRQRLDNAVRSVEGISLKAKKGDLKDVNELLNVIAIAQLTVAHQYVADFDQSEYEGSAPLPDTYYPRFKATIRAIQNAERRLSGPAKIEARKLAEEGNALIDKMDAGEEVNDVEIQKLQVKLQDFLKKYNPPKK